MSAGMVEVDGIRYRPEDLEARRAREAAIVAKRECEAASAAELIRKELGDDALDQAVEAAVAPLRDQVEKLQELVGNVVEAFGLRIGALEGANLPVGAGVPADPGSAADEAAGDGSDDAEGRKPAAKKKAVAK